MCYALKTPQPPLQSPAFATPDWVFTAVPPPILADILSHRAELAVFLHHHQALPWLLEKGRLALELLHLLNYLALKMTLQALQSLV